MADAKIKLKNMNSGEEFEIEVKKETKKGIYSIDGRFFDWNLFQPAEFLASKCKTCGKIMKFTDTSYCSEECMNKDGYVIAPDSIVYKKVCKKCGKQAEHRHIGFVDGAEHYYCKNCCDHPQCVKNREKVR